MGDLHFCVLIVTFDTGVNLIDLIGLALGFGHILESVRLAFGAHFVVVKRIEAENAFLVLIVKGTVGVEVRSRVRNTSVGVHIIVVVFLAILAGQNHGRSVVHIAPYDWLGTVLVIVVLDVVIDALLAFIRKLIHCLAIGVASSFLAFFRRALHVSSEVPFDTFEALICSLLRHHFAVGHCDRVLVALRLVDDQIIPLITQVAPVSLSLDVVHDFLFNNDVLAVRDLHCYVFLWIHWIFNALASVGRPVIPFRAGNAVVVDGVFFLAVVDIADFLTPGNVELVEEVLREALEGQLSEGKGFNDVGQVVILVQIIPFLTLLTLRGVVVEKTEGVLVLDFGAESLVLRENSIGTSGALVFVTVGLAILDLGFDFEAFGFGLVQVVVFVALLAVVEGGVEPAVRDVVCSAGIGDALFVHFQVESLLAEGTLIEVEGQ